MQGKGYAKLLISGAVLGALIYFAELERILSAVQETDPVLYAASVALFLSTYPVSGLRWKQLAESTGHELSLRKAVSVVAVSYSFNKTLPWNSGDLARSKISEKYHEVENHGIILGATALERFLDAISLITVVVFSVTLASTGIGAGLVVIPFGLMFGFGAYILHSGRIEHLEIILPERASGLLSDVSDGFRSLSRRNVLEVLGLSQAKWWMEAAVFHMLAMSLGTGTGFWEAALATSVISIFSALPLSPAGIGPGDAAASGVLVAGGMNYSVALSLVLLQRSVGVVIQGTVGALIYALDL